MAKERWWQRGRGSRWISALLRCSIFNQWLFIFRYGKKQKHYCEKSNLEIYIFYKIRTQSRCLVLRPSAIMKRKLDEHDVPTLGDTKDASKKLSNFNSLGLEARLLQAVAQQNFSIPTLVQCKAIPLVLEGKDILGSMNKSPEEIHTH